MTYRTWQTKWNNSGQNLFSSRRVIAVESCRLNVKVSVEGWICTLTRSLVFTYKDLEILFETLHDVWIDIRLQSETSGIKIYSILGEILKVKVMSLMDGRWYWICSVTVHIQNSRCVFMYLLWIDLFAQLGYIQVWHALQDAIWIIKRY